MFTVFLLGMEINWLAQIFGFIGLVVMIIGYQKPRKGFLWASIICCIFIIAESALLGGWTAVIRFIVSITRNFIIIMYLNRGREIPFFWVPIFISITVIASAFFINVWYDYLPPLFSIIFTISTTLKNYKVAKFGMLTAEFGTAVYCVFLGAYIGALRNLLLTIAVLVSLVALFKKDKPLKTGADDGNCSDESNVAIS